MNHTSQAIAISEHVHWVGAIDWDLRDFHGYATTRGTSYNAYLITAGEVTLVDTVKAPFRDELLARIASVTEPGKIRTIISNHAEMDHSGSLPALIDALKPQRVFASALGVQALRDHFGLKNITPVKDGQAIDIGGGELTFYETRMLHWPDSMFTWYAGDGVLFSNDAFGMHLASVERFTDELPWPLIAEETARYYANILMPLSKLVGRLMERMQALALPIKLVATDHGPIWRQDIAKVFELYARWAAQFKTRKAVVVYDTMWGSTARMARAIADGLREAGVSARLMSMSGSHRSEVATELLEAGALLVGSPTLNRNIFPSLADVMTYLKGLAPRNLIGAAFGSYGWSSQAVGQLTDLLRQMDVEVIDEGVAAVYVPDVEALERCRTLGRRVADRLTERIKR
jgi:flavorubredoxin